MRALLLRMPNDAIVSLGKRHCIRPKEVPPASVGTRNRRPHRSRSSYISEEHAGTHRSARPLARPIMAEYVIEIRHRPGRVHSNSDALSRRPCERNSRGKECQQCLRTIAGSKAAQARNTEASAAGQIQPVDSSLLTPSKSF